MNKLYKYLPFDIKVQYNKEVWDLLAFSNKSDKYQIGIEETNVRSHRYLANVDELKPILRPFKDLTKELPLTKAAAEIVSMEEGDFVIPAIILHSWCTLSDLYKNKEEFKIEYKDYIFYIEHLFTNKTVTIDIDYTITLFSGIPIRRSIYDFFRAMKFNLDFKEGDFIKIK